jgi:hypothetical protein
MPARGCSSVGGDVGLLPAASTALAYSGFGVR